MKVQDIFEGDGKWGTHTISTKTFTTTDGKKMKLFLYAVTKYGVHEALGLELDHVLEKGTDTYLNDELGDNLFFPDKFVNGNHEIDPISNMRTNFKAKLVPLFLNKPHADLEKAFNKAVVLIEYNLEDTKEAVMKSLLSMIKDKDTHHYSIGSSILGSIHRLEKSGIDWPELETIKKAAKDLDL